MANYKFLSTKHGVTYFASVYVESITGTKETNVFETIKEAKPEKGEVDTTTAPSWVAAAKSGAFSALNTLKSKGLLNDECEIHITKIIGSILDTNEDTVKCASEIATWKTLCPNIQPPVPYFENGIWHLKYHV